MRKFILSASMAFCVMFGAMSCNNNESKYPTNHIVDTTINLRVYGYNGDDYCYIDERFAGEFDSISYYDPNGCVLKDSIGYGDGRRFLYVKFDDNRLGIGPQRKIDMMLKTNNGKNTYRIVRDLLVQRDTIVSGDTHTLIYDDSWQEFGPILENSFFFNAMGYQNLINYYPFYYYEDNHDISDFRDSVKCDLKTDDEISYAPFMIKGDWSSYSEAVKLKSEFGSMRIVIRVDENTTGKDRKIKFCYGSTFRAQLEITQKSK